MPYVSRRKGEYFGTDGRSCQTSQNSSLFPPIDIRMLRFDGCGFFSRIFINYSVSCILYCVPLTLFLFL